MRRKPVVVVFLALVCVVASPVLIPLFLPAQPGPGVPGLKSAPGGLVTQPGTLKGKPEALAINKVILYTSGVGYFQREGQVEGNAHIDLSFPVGNINDLLKSLVIALAMRRFEQFQTLRKEAADLRQALEDRKNTLNSKPQQFPK